MNLYKPICRKRCCTGSKRKGNFCLAVHGASSLIREHPKWSGVHHMSLQLRKSGPQAWICFEYGLQSPSNVYTRNEGVSRCKKSSPGRTKELELFRCTAADYVYLMIHEEGGTERQVNPKGRLVSHCSLRCVKAGNVQNTGLSPHIVGRALSRISVRCAEQFSIRVRKRADHDLNMMLTD